MALTHNPHDHFFKALLGQPARAVEFLREHLPAEVAAQLRLETAELCKDSFVDEALRAHYSDLLYRVQLKDGKSAYIYFLFEHKSSPYPWVQLDLLRYSLKLWQHQREEEKVKHLSPIVPLVVYHGVEGWNVSTRFRDLFEVPEALQGYLPDFSYRLVDLSGIPDEQIRGQVMLRVGLLLLKYIFRPQLRERLPEVFRLLSDLSRQESGLDYLVTVLRYLSAAASQVGEEELHRVVNESLTGGEAIMATIAERWMEQGWEKGREQGKEEGREEGRVEGREEGREEGEALMVRRLLGRMSVQQAAELLGLPLDQVARLAKIGSEPPKPACEEHMEF